MTEVEPSRSQTEKTYCSDVFLGVLGQMARIPRLCGWRAGNPRSLAAGGDRRQVLGLFMLNRLKKRPSTIPGLFCAIYSTYLFGGCGMIMGGLGLTGGRGATTGGLGLTGGRGATTGGLGLTGFVITVPSGSTSLVSLTCCSFAAFCEEFASPIEPLANTKTKTIDITRIFLST